MSHKERRERERRADGERTRARILAIALPLFAESGYAGTSTRMVAQAADVNVATLAYHFDGKEGLYQAVMAGLFEDLLRELPFQPPDGVHPAIAVDGLVRALWAFASGHRLHVRLLLRHVLDNGQLPHPVVDAGYRRLWERADQLGALFRPEWPESWRHLFFLSFVHVVFRFAVEEPEQLDLLMGSPDDPDEAVVGWLTVMAYAALVAPTQPVLMALRESGVGPVLPRPVLKA